MEIKLKELVGDYQLGFIKRRNILDGILIICEVIHQVRKEKGNGCLPKLDFENACGYRWQDKYKYRTCNMQMILYYFEVPKLRKQFCGNGCYTHLSFG